VVMAELVIQSIQCPERDLRDRFSLPGSKGLGLRGDIIGNPRSCTSRHSVSSIHVAFVLRKLLAG